jgi:hypothetical protein
MCNDIAFNNDGLFPSDNDLPALLDVLAGSRCEYCWLQERSQCPTPNAHAGASMGGNGRSSHRMNVSAAHVWGP